MWSQRAVVDYALQRRATLSALFSGGMFGDDVCDAHPDLLRAAKYHGEDTTQTCPVCRKQQLTHVTYVYGDELGQYAGRVRQTRELPLMAQQYGEFQVYVVEVCRGCAWNHLTRSYVLGTGKPPAPRKRRTAER